ncbi:sugar transferase [Photobacterium proteolyticum]|uniref:Sugar transferase n=1 Tax=Photobacterium proteolyticum TaxID=1903952 RepID=A0A1Q9GLS7_9GAMM|nr:TIGR03013 family XrtA/PEP-CTERM system glycosyltransferase [Photobacterium proteolyticum]OLQ75510.1 sugar transferase [Photobacterium proteolyticum]
MRYHDLNKSNTVLIVTDFIVAFTVFALGLSLTEEYYSVSLPNIGESLYFVQLFLFSCTLQLATLAVGLYNEKLRATNKGIAIRIMVAIGLAYIMSSFIYLFIPVSSFPLLVCELLYLLAAAGLLVSRHIARSTDYTNFNRRRVVVLGAGERASLINSCMKRRADRVNFDLVGYIPINGDSRDITSTVPRVEIMTSLDDYITDNNIDEIIIGADERRGNLPTDMLFNCKLKGVLITDIIDFIERETGQVAVSHINPSWVIYNVKPSGNIVERLSGWMFNCIISSFVLLLTWPLIIIATLFIKIEDGVFSPVLYSQKRVGRQGKVFSIYKFRSMKVNAEENGAQMSFKSDKRITKVGAFLRKYRIDELPQLYNVIKGDMSFVGPRPERPEFCQQFDGSIPYYSQRHDVKPGLTGWAQLKYPYGDSLDDATEKLKFDLYYIKHRSFMLDVLILIRTSEIILFGKGR